MVSMRSENPICAPSHLSDSFFQFPLKRFQCSSDRRWPSLVVSKNSVEHFLFPRFSTPGDRLCPQVVAQAPQLSRSSEKQATCECCYGRQFIHSVVSLHSGMSRAVHPQKFRRWVSTIATFQSALPILFFVANSLNL